MLPMHGPQFFFCPTKILNHISVGKLHTGNKLTLELATSVSVLLHIKVKTLSGIVIPCRLEYVLNLLAMDLEHAML